MPTFKYRTRYQHNGPPPANPLLELDEDDILRNFRLFLVAIENHFQDFGGKVEMAEDGIVSITADITQQKCDDIVEGYLRSLYLVADKVTPQ